MGASNQQDGDPAGVTNALFGGVVAVVVATFLAACGFLFNPSALGLPAGLNDFVRCFMIGLITACIGFGYMIEMLGGAKPRGKYRAWYAAFRARLNENDALLPYARANYGRAIEHAIKLVDRFMGDAEKPRSGFISSGGGLLRVPAPLWTGRSYDRCVLLALGYPLACVLASWGWTGHIGTLETALAMHAAPWWFRAIAVGSAVISVFALARAMGAEGWRSVKWFILNLAALFISTFLGAGGALAALVCVAFLSSKEVFSFLGLGIAVSAAVLFVEPGLVAVTMTFAASVIGGAILATLVERSEKRLAWALALSSVVLLCLCLALPSIMAGSPKGRVIGFTLVYFLGLLTIVNAPFDWIALGFTRLLLRLGNQLKGFAPFLLALLDLVVSLALMATLAIVWLWATELYNHQLVLHGIKPPLPVEPLLDQIANPARRGDMSLWWLYATLFSTQIPAALNLLLATFCLLRGVPRINRYLAGRLPESGSFGVWARLPVAAIWSGQLGAAIFFGLAMLYLIYVWGGIFLVDQRFGSLLPNLLHALSIAPLLG